MGGHKQLRSISIGGSHFSNMLGWRYPAGRRTIALHAWGRDKTGSPLHAEVATYALARMGTSDARLPLLPHYCGYVPLARVDRRGGGELATGVQTLARDASLHR